MIRLVLSLFFISSVASAFPALTRHGYFNCTACHVSPSGGGHLTEYGRGLSAELLSMWANPGEEKSFYGLVPDSKNLTVAGYVRALQILTNNKISKDAKAIVMQADLELAGHLGPLTAVGSVGRREIAKPGGGEQEQVFSRTHYLLYSSPFGASLRVGKFLPAWGLNFPNHYLLVRRDLGFGNDTERDTLEGSYLAETYSIIATHVFGPGADSHARNREKANSVSIAKALGESSRIGLGYYHGSTNTSSKGVWNLNGIFSLTNELYSQWEADYLMKVRPSISRGLAITHQLCWEVKQGFIPYVEIQWENLKQPDPNSRIFSKGIGANWYPRTHFELQLYLGQESRADLVTSIGYGMMNLYF